MIKQQILFEYLTGSKYLLTEKEISPDSEFRVDRVFTQENGKIGYRQTCTAVVGVDDIKVIAPFELPSGLNKPEKFYLSRQDINEPELGSPHTPSLEISLQYKKIRQWYLNWRKPSLEDVKLSSRFLWVRSKSKEF